MIRTTLAVGVAALVAGCAIAVDEKNPLDGKWTIESVTRNGKVDTSLKGAVREHVGEKYTITPPKDSNAVATEGTFTFDAEKKTIDMKPTSGTFKGKTLFGVYKLEGDTLTVAFAEKERPKDFESKEGSGLVVAVMKKVK